MRHLTSYKAFESYVREHVLYRGAGPDEALRSCETGHLIYDSQDPMSRDWEVIEYGLGDAAAEMSEQEVEEYVDGLVGWTPTDKGVNLTSDLGNAKGYSDIVLEVGLVGPFAEFSDVHVFAKNPEDCLVRAVHYDGVRMTPVEFMEKIA